MNIAKKLICALAAGAALAATPAFADSFHSHGYYDRYGHSYRDYDRDYRHDARWYRDHPRDRVVVVERRPYPVHRTVVVEQPVYYNPPAAPNTLGSIIGSVIDYVDQR